jgi:hypothetical protein
MIGGWGECDLRPYSFMSLVLRPPLPRLLPPRPPPEFAPRRLREPLLLPRLPLDERLDEPARLPLEPRLLRDPPEFLLFCGMTSVLCQRRMVEGRRLVLRLLTYSRGSSEAR